MLSKLDMKIIGLISRDIPLTEKPFKDLADQLGIDESLLLGRMRAFKKSGLMRKFAASLNHRKIGFRHNAMTVWNVPKKLVDKAGAIMASFSEVSHCYERKPGPGWDYNLYCMVHGKTKRGCLRTVDKIADAIGENTDHKALFSSKEEKKTGARYEKA